MGSGKVRDQALVVAVDFDGTVVEHEYPDIGRDIGAVPWLQALAGYGAKIILWTMRDGEDLVAAELWFARNSIPLFGVQRNPTQDAWTSSPKAYANIYVDDAALGCPLVLPTDGRRPYVDWSIAGPQLLYAAAERMGEL